MRFLCGFLALFLFLNGAVGAGTAAAQSIMPGAESSAPAKKDEAAEPEKPKDEAAPEEKAAADPDIPKQLLNPYISSAELKMRLTPLTKDELATVAAKWLDLVKDRTTMVMNEQVELLKAKGDRATASREDLVRLTKERNELLNKLSLVVDAWETKGGDEAKIKTFRTYRAAILSEEAKSTDFETFMVQFEAWLSSPDGGIEAGVNIGIVITAIIVLLIIAGLIRRVTRRWIGHIKHMSKLLQAFIVTFVYWMVLALGLLIVVSAIGIDVGPVFALIGGASFILAFAFQDTLGNLASGLMIMINRPFDEGDYVDVAGVAGTVKSVSIVATKVLTPDNQIIVIPNKQVWGQVITNVTGSKTRRVDLTFGIGYNDSIETAQKVLEETVDAHPLVLREPAPNIRVSELADSSVNFIVRPWAKSEDYWTVYWDLTRQVKEAFDRAGISIPFPQQDMHVYQVNAQPEQAAEDKPARRRRASKPTAKPKPARQTRASRAKAQAQGGEGYDSDDTR
ncbi:Small-conductance mechanosensitive channel [Methyloligella halotolerans]|uniref:Small-conductance mechanosensitive channel n=1 Tax=Methyloligella halotolerans TaxID=1177755 RepID=A0A1E2RUU9_9HYPH|nr:mechanosensitive ion channel family protein [Methyloligella halotolerans]ODA65981.1 Small-conductance mechanosensitive channel [Methyloligella halotolerans]